MAKVKRDTKLQRSREIKDEDFRPGEHYFTETAMQKDESGNAVAAPKVVWGIVDPRATGDRKNPPKIDIFDTSDSFFDIGHLMALEVGGGDHQANFIPQFREQNQHAEWKRMESELREHAKTAWKTHGRYTYMQVHVAYDPAGGLVPTALDVTVYELPKADFPADPDDVAGWRTAPPAKKVHATSKSYHNKLTDQDLVNTGMKKVEKDDEAHWEQYMVGKLLDQIEQNPELSSSVKPKIEQEVLIQLFDTGGGKLSKPQQRKVDLYKSTFKAATKRTLVSEPKRKALEEREDYDSDDSSTVPGRGQDWQLDSFRGRYGKGGEEPVRRRSSSPAPKSKKRKLEQLQTTVNEAVKRHKPEPKGPT